MTTPEQGEERSGFERIWNPSAQDVQKAEVLRQTAMKKYAAEEKNQKVRSRVMVAGAAALAATSGVPRPATIDTAPSVVQPESEMLTSAALHLTPSAEAPSLEGARFSDRGAISAVRGLIDVAQEDPWFMAWAKEAGGGNYDAERIAEVLGLYAPEGMGARSAAPGAYTDKVPVQLFIEGRTIRLSYGGRDGAPIEDVLMSEEASIPKTGYRGEMILTS